MIQTSKYRILSFLANLFTEKKSEEKQLCEYRGGIKLNKNDNFVKRQKKAETGGRCPS